MANRHLSRSIVLQTLYEWDFNNKELSSPISEVLMRNAEEFAPGMNEHDYINNLLEGVLKKQDKLDVVIEKAAPEWPLEKIATVDRNILRIGLYELLFADRNQVPPKVAINEAIELAKSFGGESSGRFVNGVLGSVYRELGEPGKDQTSKKIKNIPYEQMPIERHAGAVIFRKTEEGIVLALVHDVFGHWTLIKDDLLDGEGEKEGAVRAVREKLGLEVAVGEALDENEYIANDPENGKTRKQVVYFLAEAKNSDITLADLGGIDQARWFKLDEIMNLNFYDDIVPIVTKAVKQLI